VGELKNNEVHRFVARNYCICFQHFKLTATAEWLNMSRGDMRKRVETFKAKEQHFQREREEYYATAMENSVGPVRSHDAIRRDYNRLGPRRDPELTCSANIKLNT
jgi:hypothetical protein